MTFKSGASASINKTISDIEAILDGENLKFAGPKRKELRSQLMDALINASKKWYKKGFNRGHIESYREFLTSKTVPRVLEVNVQREFLPNSKKEVMLKSTVKKNIVKP